MSLVLESAHAHAGTVVSKREVVVGFTPADDLGSGERGVLLVFVVFAQSPVLAPATFPLALLAVVRSVCHILVVHFEDLVEAELVLCVLLFFILVLLLDICFLEVVDVGVLHRELCLQSLDLCLSALASITLLMLKD